MSKAYSSGSGTTFGYTVEVRTTFSENTVHPCGFIVDKEWRRVPYRLVKCDRDDHNHFQSGRVGEIAVWNYNHELDNLNLLDFNAAYALACQFRTQLWNASCVEFRIVKVKVTYTFDAQLEGAGPIIQLDDIARSMKFEKEPPCPKE